MTHHNRRRRYSDPEQAFNARTEPLAWTDCIVWMGAINDDDYGQMRIDGRMILAHRYAWLREKGPIIDGLECDHVCRNRSCVNIEHLRLATRSENSAYRAPAVRDLPTNVYATPAGGYYAKLTKEGATYRTRVFEHRIEAEISAWLGSREFHGTFSPYPPIPDDIVRFLAAH